MPHVEVNEVLGFMSDVGSEVPAYDTVPCGIVLLVELFLDECSNIFLNVEFLKGLIGGVNCILLHLFVHVCVLDDGFALGCGHFKSPVLNKKYQFKSYLSI